VRTGLKAFTLIELSIVLVIIGLLVGAVLIGTSLITTAKTRQGIAQTAEIKTAIGAFRDKYLCLPGDCANMTNFFTSASQPEKVTNGNGNGIIDAVDVGNLNGWGTAEVYYVFDHLAAAGLINFNQYDETASSVVESGTGYPEAKFEASGTAKVNNPGVARASNRPGILIGYQVGIGYIPARHVVAVGFCRFREWGGGYIAGECALNPWEAFSVDDKIDDGVPTTGQIVVVPTGFYMTPGNGFGSGPPQCSTMTFDSTTGLTTSAGVYRNEKATPITTYERTCLLEMALGL
jgi:prepilin-type N-terminal cleavage/methylation domain-containing protein